MNRGENLGAANAHSDDLPKDQKAAEAYALMAANKGEWAEALRRWRDFQSSFPDHPSGYVEAGVAARELGKFDEAERFLNEALERFPGHIWAMLHRARTTTRRLDWKLALSRWQECLDQLPNDPEVNVEIGAALRELKRLDEADLVLRGATERFPNYRWGFVNYAWVAARRPDWAEALCRWQAVRDRFPDEPSGIVESGLALCELGLLDDAEKTLAQGVALFSNNFWGWFHFANVAARAGNWLMAAERWKQVIARFPEVGTGYAKLGEAYLKCGAFDEAEEILRTPPYHFLNWRTSLFSSLE